MYYSSKKGERRKKRGNAEGALSAGLGFLGGEVMMLVGGAVGFRWISSAD